MPHPDLAVVTGAFSYTGRYVAWRLLQHELDSVRTWPDHLRPRGREYEDAVRGRKRAGVGRVVHFLVTNPSSDSGLPYFRGKARVEDMLVGLLMRDMALTRDEVVGLMDGLLTSDEPPTGRTRLSDWAAFLIG